MLSMTDPNYRIVTELKVTGGYRYSADGPGLGYDKVWVDKESEAETLCRMLGQAYRAGKIGRSREFRQLLDDDGVRR